jgi:hypothetical protein
MPTAGRAVLYAPQRTAECPSKPLYSALANTPNLIHPTTETRAGCEAKRWRQKNAFHFILLPHWFMRVRPSLPQRPITQEEFASLDYQVMHHAFHSHDELGRLCDEVIYQIASIWPTTRLIWSLWRGEPAKEAKPGRQGLKNVSIKSSTERDQTIREFGERMN